MSRPTKVVNIAPLNSRSPVNPHYVQPRHDFATPLLIHPATMPAGSLSMAHEWRNAAQRPGADDHRQWHSLGRG